MSRLWFMPATPILSNGGAGRGLPISCFLNAVPDSLRGIRDTWNQNIDLAANGGGIGTYWGGVRSIGEGVGQAGQTSGIIPFIHVMDSLTLAISQGSLRRGSAAVYLDIHHPEIEEFLEIRKPSGDFNRKSLNLHHGVNVTDAFMVAVRDGKSATPEYGFLPTTEPVAFGPTHNPWNLARSSGGSSGGSAAAVAAGVVPFAHANDGGGSIRIPSANCGLFGLKPSRGRMIPGRPSSRALDIAVEHCVTRSVRDSATLFAATEQTQAGAPLAPVGLVTGPDKRRLKVGLIVVTLTGGPPDPEVRVATEEAAKLLEALGHHVDPARWPVDGVRFGQDFTTLWASGAAALVDGVAKHIGRRPDETMLEPFTLAMADLVRQLPPGGLDKAVANLKADSAAYDRWFDAYDVIVSPVLGKPPVELGYVAPTVDMPTLIERLTGYVGYTTLHNVAGAPAMSVPLHWTPDGLPVGVQFAARAGQERTLFQLAYELERARPWAGRHPPLWAA